jgi:RNA-directed DNA polymerase
MTTTLTCFTHWAANQPQKRYTALMGILGDVRGLAESYRRQDTRKAVGIDGVHKEAYGENLQGNLVDLSSRLRRLGYRPKPARRVYIPKSNGGRRPLGIPSFEDRLVQDRLSQILSAIWEPEFRDCSFGFRPGRNAHQALARLDHIIVKERTQWMVEADIKGFFDNVNHDHLLRFVAHRLGDKNLLRIIQRLLKAGHIDAGQFRASDRGTPQGGLVSPVLANIYLHYVLDVWFEKRVARQCRGKAYMVRFADDFVACFDREDDARGFERELAERLSQFGLEVEPTKTALLRFGDLAPALCRREGRRKPATFNFLGFTHYMKVGPRGGHAKVVRKTQRDRFSKKLKAVKEQLIRLRTQPVRVIQRYVRQHLQGHYQYYGVSGNSRSLHLYQWQVQKLLHKWLNRRSQRRSFTWKQFSTWLMTWYPKARIVHRW